MPAAFHVPVLLDVAVRFLMTDPEWTYVDGTIGGGGHAAEICRKLSARGRFVGFDRDSEALAAAGKVLAPYGRQVVLVHANFQQMGDELTRLGISGVGGVLLDLGVSSHQLNAGDRGFSYQRNGPLDMRMDRNQGKSAVDVVNRLDEGALADILYRYGEERASRRIARAIVRRRPIGTTGELSDAVESAVGGRFLVKTLARVFQALRIEVNNELDNLTVVLEQALQLLCLRGRLVVVSYHSLEDRIVKDFFRQQAASRIRSGHKLAPDIEREPKLRILTAHPVEPADSEVAVNPSARSAKLRAAEKCIP